MNGLYLDEKLTCTNCNSDALYKYGHAWTGKQRYLCMMCGTQFTGNAGKLSVKGKPVCPVCGKSMHVYKLEGEVIRFRCAGYPVCKTYRKFRMKEEKDELLHS